jgi:hypothetical protein
MSMIQGHSDEGGNSAWVGKNSRDPIGYDRPFRDYVRFYRKAGWFGVFPIRDKNKSPPPTGLG